jgi:glycine/D-amino acid oxidase-like deaminating enzyme
MRHTRTGWWLEEAGDVTPRPPLEGDARADVVVVGGGYLGLWTAWQLRELEPELDVLVLEAGVCGHGPSGRNGGFCETLWGDAPTLREKVGDAAALAVCRASEDAVRGVGAWCEANDVDAWFREAPMLRVATTESQVGSWDDTVRAAAALGAPEEVVVSADDVRARCASPLFLGGELYRLNATVQPARLALGLRARLLERGVRIHERTEVTRLHREGGVDTRLGRVRAGATVLAVNSAASSFPGYRRSLAVASSHIVLTEPVSDVLDELGWTGGEAIVDSRRLVHYMRTTRDGRIAFGWGGGAMGFAGRVSDRMELDRGVIASARKSLMRFFPQTRGREVTHAWGGPIDVSPTHLPIFGSRGRVHHGFGFTGNGVGPTYLGGEILARLALDRRDDGRGSRSSSPDASSSRRSRSATRVESSSGALIAKDAAEDDGREPNAPTLRRLTPAATRALPSALARLEDTSST